MKVDTFGMVGWICLGLAKAEERQPAKQATRVEPGVERERNPGGATRDTESPQRGRQKQA
jgi:hypothetical protein